MSSLNLSSSALSPKMSRLLALSLLVIVLAGILNLVILPLAERRQAAEARIADAAEWRARLSAVIGRLPELEQRLSALQAAAKQRQGMLHAENPALASAEMQQQVQRPIAEAGGQPRSIQALPPRREHDALHIGMRVRATVQEAALAALLDSAERQDPALAIRQLTLGGVLSGRSGGPTLIDLQADFEALASEAPR
jgi:hypothetical protein